MEGVSLSLNQILKLIFNKSVIRLFEESSGSKCLPPPLESHFMANMSYEEKLRKNLD